MPEPTACLTPSESERRIAAARDTVETFRASFRAVSVAVLTHRTPPVSDALRAALALADLVDSWLPPVESGEGTAVGALGG